MTVRTVHTASRHLAAPELPGMHPVRAATGLTVRLAARGTLILAGLLALYSVLEIISYNATYADASSRAALQMFDTPAVRMLQGPPHGIDTAGGFTAWDDGWVMGAVTAIWAMLTSTRFLRGEEDDDRVAPLLAAALPARVLAAVQLAVLGAAALLFAGSVTVAMGLSGEDWTGDALFGLAIGGFAALWAATGAVCAQVLDTRRRALSAAAALFGAAYVLRLVANSTEDRGWLRRLTPWGWLDEVEPFAARRGWAVAAFWVAALLLAVLAVALRGRRDTGGAFVTLADRRAPRLRWLGGPARFAWHESRGVLAAWVVGLAVWAGVIGAMTGTMLDFLAADESYRRMLDALGMSMMLRAEGFIGVLAGVFGVCFALYAVWRVAAARTDEATGRLDSILVLPVTRRRWLTGHVLLALAGAGVLAVACAATTWVGTRQSGAGLHLDAALRAMLNQLPVAVLFVGFATLVLGLAPRLTQVLPASLAGLTYVVELVGPGLDWPAWVLDLSPFHHLALVPAEPFALVPALVLTGLGLVAATVGVEAFGRRDLAAA